MKNKIKTKLHKMVTDQDIFGETINLHLDNEKNLNTICGGLWSIFYKFIFLGLFVWSMVQIMQLSDYDITYSIIFHDVKEMDPIDFTDYIHDIIFGFNFNGEPIDMLNNEFVTPSFVY